MSQGFEFGATEEAEICSSWFNRRSDYIEEGSQSLNGMPNGLLDKAGLYIHRMRVQPVLISLVDNPGH